MRDLSDILFTANEHEIVAYRGKQAIYLSELRRDIAGNAARLAKLNCGRGLLITQDSYWCLVGIIALFQIGSEAILPQNSTDGAKNAIKDEWDVLVTDQPVSGANNAFLLAAGTAVDVALREIEPASCQLALFTSGSTGESKKVTKTLAVMLKEAAAIEVLLGKAVPLLARVLGMVTHQHLFGLSYKLIWPFFSGRPFEARVHQFWEEVLAEKFNGAAIVVSPAHLKRLGDFSIASKDIQLGCLISAGAALSDDVAIAAQKEFGAPLCEIYGSTETGTIASRWRNIPDQPWMPAPGVSVDINEEAGLRVRSPFLPDRDWFQTEDRAETLLDGFYLIGRRDRIVKIEGKRVGLAEVEASLEASPLVVAAKVLPIGSVDTVLVAVVLPSEEGRAELSQLGSFRFGRLLRQSLSTRHEAAAMPRRWRFVSEMPVGPLGKTSQKDLLALFEAKREPEVLETSRNGDELELDLFNPTDLIQLEGHFPNVPIIPGVAQIDWVVKFAAQYLGLQLTAAQDYRVKFHRLTLPGTRMTLVLTHDRAHHRLSFSYQHGDVVFTSGMIRLVSS